MACDEAASSDIQGSHNEEAEGSNLTAVEAGLLHMAEPRHELVQLCSDEAGGALLQHSNAGLEVALSE